MTLQTFGRHVYKSSKCFDNNYYYTTRNDGCDGTRKEYQACMVKVRIKIFYKAF